MTTEIGIYHWKLGDVALARMCRKVYTRVKVIKDHKGLFYDDKGKIIFYFFIARKVVIYRRSQSTILQISYNVQFLQFCS